MLLKLRERGQGRQESGAFLLGREIDGVRVIEDFILYDDVDPNALRGIIMFDGSKMDKVWQRCEATGLQVVADVHTHPYGYQQSHIDQANPMIPQSGHIAMIVPNFAQQLFGPEQVGIFEYRGKGRWKDHSATRYLALSWW